MEGVKEGNKFLNVLMAVIKIAYKIVPVRVTSHNQRTS